MAIDTDWFHQALNSQRKSLRDLARFLGIDPSAVSRMLKGERKMTAEEQDQIAQFLGVGVLDVAARRRGERPGFEESVQHSYVPLGGGDRRVSSRSGRVDPTDPDFVHPAFGCMIGTITVADGVDLTAPMDWDEEWGDKLYNE